MMYAHGMSGCFMACVRACACVCVCVSVCCVCVWRVRGAVAVAGQCYVAYRPVCPLKVVANSCRESLGVVDVPRCVSRLSSPLALPPEATRAGTTDRQHQRKDTLDVLVTDASLVIAARAVLCAALATGDVLDGGRLWLLRWPYDDPISQPMSSMRE